MKLGRTVKMTDLLFKGSEFVCNHHLAVPHRPLVPDVCNSAGTPDLAGNLIIQGDNARLSITERRSWPIEKTGALEMRLDACLRQVHV